MTAHIHGKTALVTGGSRGLGRAICQALADSGAQVIVSYAHSTTDAFETVARIQAAGGKALALQADVTQEAEVERLVGEVTRQWGTTIDILVNNATGPQPMLSLEENTWESYLDQLVFFVKAPLLLAKAIVPAMREKRWGRIINIGSEVVQLGNANFSNYVTAKGAMLGMTRSWASELGSAGITVNLVAPGWIPVERHAGIEESAFDSYRATMPLGHMGEPMDIGQAVAFLASDASGFITGQQLTVNGGKTFGI